MKLKTYKLILQTLYILMFLPTVGFVITGELFYLGLALVLVALYGVFRYKFWRCPKCGAQLARGSGIHCSECHWDDPN